MLIKTALEVAAVVLLLAGYWNEDKVVEFEQKMWRTICDGINQLIRNYERRKGYDG